MRFPKRIYVVGSPTSAVKALVADRMFTDKKDAILDVAYRNAQRARQGRAQDWRHESYVPEGKTVVKAKADRGAKQLDPRKGPRR